MIETIHFSGEEYPLLQAAGNASQFAVPFAKHICAGVGVDVGFCKDAWKFPGAVGADIEDNSNKYHAHNLPENLDYIYSSHCLEHIPDWVGTIAYWATKLKSGGVLFLYLPHRDQKYWRPWNNRKHLHILDAPMVAECMKSYGFKNIFYSERDLNHSFIIVGEQR